HHRARDAVRHQHRKLRLFRGGFADCDDGLRDNGRLLQVHAERQCDRLRTRAMLAEIVTSLLVLIGGAFALIGSIGLARLPDFFTRLHGPTKATTLGVGSIVVASLIDVSAEAAGISFRELAISLFLFITAPVSAHLLAKAALRSLRAGEGPGGDAGSGRGRAESDGAPSRGERDR